MRDRIFKVNVFANALSLLDRLAAKNNPETLPVYRSLIRGLLEIYRGKKSDREIDQVASEIILKGFATVFDDAEEE